MSIVNRLPVDPDTGAALRARLNDYDESTIARVLGVPLNTAAQVKAGKVDISVVEVSVLARLIDMDQFDFLGELVKRRATA